MDMSPNRVVAIMAKVMPLLTVLVLAGCASMGEWRELRIDGSNESAFDESISRLDAELPYSHRLMFQLALTDIMGTEAQSSRQTSNDGAEAYTKEEYRRQLDGLTYEGVIALADRTGPSIRSVHYSSRTQRDPWAGRPWPGTDPNRFPPPLVVPPGMSP
jgi:hypothetical protein